MLICNARSLKKLTSSLCGESRIPRRKPCFVTEHDDTYRTLYIRRRRAIQRQATAYYRYPASSMSISCHIGCTSIKCRHARIIRLRPNLLMARKRVSYICRRAWGGKKFQKWYPGGPDPISNAMLFTNQSLFPNPEHTVPSVYLHLITDKEKGFRTAVWFPVELVNADGKPVELILHFSVHKSM